MDCFFAAYFLWLGPSGKEVMSCINIPLLDTLLFFNSPLPLPLLLSFTLIKRDSDVHQNPFLDVVYLSTIPCLCDLSVN